VNKPYQYPAQQALAHRPLQATAPRGAAPGSRPVTRFHEPQSVRQGRGFSTGKPSSERRAGFDRPLAVS